MKAGIYRERAKDECALDVMLETERLGWPENAGRRYDAGLWLRQLYLKLHKSDGISRYSKESWGRGEISEQVAWNWKCYLDTMAALKGHWSRLYALCCNNQQPMDRHWEATIDALDALADHRHIA